jgi:hypothetical protein
MEVNRIPFRILALAHHTSRPHSKQIHAFLGQMGDGHRSWR